MPSAHGNVVKLIVVLAVLILSSKIGKKLLVLFVFIGITVSPVSIGVPVIFAKVSTNSADPTGFFSVMVNGSVWLLNGTMSAAINIPAETRQSIPKIKSAFT